MIKNLFEIIMLIARLLSTVFSKRVFLFAEPTHPNLGDQAQLMCTEEWIAQNYPGRKVIHTGMLFRPFDDSLRSHVLNPLVLKLLLLKIFVKQKDLFIGHSGYFFVDHHNGWFTYYSLIRRFKNRFIILPQTINFYAPVVKEKAKKAFSNRNNLIILCRDEVSYSIAQDLFEGTKLFLYPDIVTSLIGTKQYRVKREGILFIIRNDIERHYSNSEIACLKERFAGKRIGQIDTTIEVSHKEIKKHRDKLVWECIEKIATYQVVITDRYHGTIFSAIASTPVIVINSADHKLSSGVKWFPQEQFGDAVQYASNLDDAYAKAENILKMNQNISNPPFFKNNYWDKLNQIL